MVATVLVALVPLMLRSGLGLIVVPPCAAIRRRVQSAVDHRFDRDRYDAERIVGAFASSLRRQTGLSHISDGVADAVTRSFGPDGAAVWIPSPGGSGGTVA